MMIFGGGNLQVKICCWYTESIDTQKQYKVYKSFYTIWLRHNILKLFLKIRESSISLF